ncbi:MAG: hypothetical protein RLZZ342_239 [Candidatus Parcubacteria bacterium]|jgi:hypothetical protein
MGIVANENSADKTLSLGVNVPTAALNLYRLEQIRIAMQENTHEATIARVFREFAEGCGIEFFPPSPELYRFLKTRTPPAPKYNQDTRGKLLVAWLPVPKTSSFTAVLLRRTRSESIVYVVEKSLRWAYRKYVVNRGKKSGC